MVEREPELEDIDTGQEATDRGGHGRYLHDTGRVNKVPIGGPRESQFARDADMGILLQQGDVKIWDQQDEADDE